MSLTDCQYLGLSQLPQGKGGRGRGWGGPLHLQEELRGGIASLPPPKGADRGATQLRVTQVSPRSSPRTSAMREHLRQSRLQV